jgi:hypothetical protein
MPTAFPDVKMQYRRIDVSRELLLKNFIPCQPPELLVVSYKPVVSLIENEIESFSLPAPINLPRTFNL